MKQQSWLAGFMLVMSLAGIGLSVRKGQVAIDRPFAQPAVPVHALDGWWTDNPELHLLRGQILLLDPAALDPAAARLELEQAAGLAPANFYIQISLAKAYERENRLDAAQACFDRACRLAPNYFEPWWQQANFLVRTGQLAAAAQVFHKSLGMEETNCEYALELLWEVSEHNPELLDRATPGSFSARLTLVEFLFHKGDVAAAERFEEKVPRATTSAEEDRVLRFSELLLTQEQPQLSWKIWHRLVSPSPWSGPGSLLNGDFSQPLSNHSGGFDWNFTSPSPEAQIQLDDQTPTGTGKSLRIRYASPDSHSFDHCSQRVLVIPGMTYRLWFWVQSEKLFSQSLPFVEISDALGKAAFTRTLVLPVGGTTQWQRCQISFAVPAAVPVISVRLRRAGNGPETNLCPIFGQIRVTGFQLDQETGLKTGLN